MTVMLEVPPDLETALQTRARERGLTVQDYLLVLVERDRSVPAPPLGSENWTLQDALDYAGPPPEDLATACAVASQDALKRIWDSREDNAAWPTT